jgi:hypothetical protein
MLTLIFVLEHQTLEIVRIGGNPREIFDNELVEPIHADLSGAAY